MRHLFFLLSILLFSSNYNAQIENDNSNLESPEDYIKYEIRSELYGDNIAIVAKINIAENWHINAANLPPDCYQMQTSIDIDSSNLYTIEDTTIEPSPNHSYDENAKEHLYLHDGEIEIKRIIKLNTDSTFILKGYFSYQTCDDKHCLPPYTSEFNLEINNTKQLLSEVIPELPLLNLGSPIEDCGSEEEEENKSYWSLFILGFLGGLVALITPCVFPMIPLTVSFFTKGGQNRRSGTMKAAFYGFSIVLIYGLLGVIVGSFFVHDPEILNRISTGFWLNFIFFIVFIVFAISFFGYFEISLPTSWANKADSAADYGGIIGIFFMAIVLAIVSFSCTGPILGSVLVNALSQGSGQLIVTMVGFGLGLGIPFTVFAMFPTLLKSLPSSGGWLNTVKVVLGFIEVALAIKFLSNADYVYQFGIVKRETFFLVWIIVSFLTFAYLLGFFKFPLDTKGAKISSTRKIISIPFLLFAIYLLPGIVPENKQLWSTSIVSGFPPATNYSWYDNQGDHHHTDFYEACEEAKKLGKPILIDFTGYACVNCRKMEENVWTDPEIKKLMSNYVIVSLYVDDKNELPKNKQTEISIKMADGSLQTKQIISIGDQNSTFEAKKFGKVSQPYYVLLNSCKGELLTNPVGYTPNTLEYAKWLKCGIDAYDENGFEIDTSSQEEVTTELIKPITWSVKKQLINESEIEIEIKGLIEDGWHTYSTKLPMSDEGPLGCWITFEPSDSYQLIDDIVEENAHSYYDETWKMDIIDFSNEAIFKQKIKVFDSTKFTLKGNVNFMVCKDGSCLPPEDYKFEIVLNE